MEYELNDLVNFFKSIKQLYGNYNICFISKRFLDMYTLLANNPDIIFNLYDLYDEGKKHNYPTIYINDINLENPNKINKYDGVITYYRVNNMEDSMVKEVPYIDDRDIEKIDSYPVYPFGGFYRQISYKGVLKPVQALDFIAKESNFVSSYTNIDAMDYVPEHFRKYYNFYSKYEKEIKHFLSKWYEVAIEYSNTSVSEDKLIDRRNDILNEMLAGDFNMTLEIINFLKASFGYEKYFELSHECINPKVKVMG
ncbi:MAG: hypothetical protein IJ565_05400 [Bacilli bacterium]|nr:hypothetical protein [Bacilli bacterium]